MKPSIRRFWRSVANRGCANPTRSRHSAVPCSSSWERKRRRRRQTRQERHAARKASTMGRARRRDGRQKRDPAWRSQGTRTRCARESASPPATRRMTRHLRGRTRRGLPGCPWRCRTRLRSEDGVPVAGVQKTTLRTFTVEGEEKNGLHPHIRWAKTPDFVHVYRGISPMNRVFFHTATVSLVRPASTRRAFQIGP